MAKKQRSRYYDNDGDFYSGRSVRYVDGSGDDVADSRTDSNRARRMEGEYSIPSPSPRTRFYDGDYSGPLNKARRLESNDFEMISEDRNAVANLPQDVKYHAWPTPGYYAEFNIDDTIRGVNKQMAGDGAQMRKHRSKVKY